MTDPKTPVEPRGPLSEAERACFDLMANGGGYMSPSNAACTALDLDTALRATLKERDEARRERDKWKDEYENVCKFATDYEQQRDALRAQLDIAREGLRLVSEFSSRTVYSTADTERQSEIARATLAKLEEKPHDRP